MNVSEPIEELLFLETTIQVDRIIGTQDRRDAIRHNIRDRRLCTSGHVLGEYNRTLVRNAVTFRDLLRSSPDVADAVARLSRYAPVGRKFHRTMTLLAYLGFDADKKNTLDRLEMFIEWRAHDLFWESIDRSACPNQIGCGIASWQGEQDSAGQYDTAAIKCLKANPPQCRVEDFIHGNRDALEQFVSVAKNHSNGDVARAASAFEAILAGTATPFGERSCYPISDTLIVLESPPGSSIYSTDGDVHDIGQILGRRLHSEEDHIRA